jgi:hypothetical protein
MDLYGFQQPIDLLARRAIKRAMTGGYPTRGAAYPTTGEVASSSA